MKAQKFVLLVEDDQIITQIFERVFENQGCARLDTASTIREALDKILFCVYDFVFLDMKIDGSNYAGMEVLRMLNRIMIKVRSENRSAMDSLVVIMSSSISLQDIMMEANALGVLSFVNKPVHFTEEYLLRIVQRLGLPLLPRRTVEP